MSDRDNDVSAVDPPESQPGGTKAPLDLNPTGPTGGEEEKDAIDPPSNDGGTQ